MKTIKVVAAIIHKDGKIFATQRGYGAYKDYWEFPGGKIEEGETPEQALIREIQEELATTIQIEQFLTTVEYDYPEFHLSMDCFICSILQGQLKLLEHESASWLSKEHLRDVNWLPADLIVIDALMSSGLTD
ncbi:MAG: (deoxy)nucleoside triphosphate pyrophosphohydrolase [Lachnospiraceae bacterium]|nr:(deoxy)nucleoside triphosphate pyrophosphohydrolase [Lachnospiraceae bacterium]